LVQDRRFVLPISEADFVKWSLKLRNPFQLIFLFLGSRSCCKGRHRDPRNNAPNVSLFLHKMVMVESDHHVRSVATGHPVIRGAWAAGDLRFAIRVASPIRTWAAAWVAGYSFSADIRSVFSATRSPATRVWREILGVPSVSHCHFALFSHMVSSLGCWLLIQRSHPVGIM